MDELGDRRDTGREREDTAPKADRQRRGMSFIGGIEGRKA